MQKSRILVIDDEEIIRQLLSRTFGERGYGVETAKDGSVALEKIKRSFFNLLIADLKMPKVGGMDILKEIKKVNPYIEVIILTGYPTIESAVESIKIGAYDFICKPFDIQEMESTVSRCLEKQKFALNHIELSELITFFEISKTIIAITSLDSLLKLILDSALGVVKAKRGSLLLLDERTKELKIKVARGLSEEVISNARIKPGEGVCGRVFKEKKPALVTDIEQDSRFQSNNKPQYETRSFLSIPLVSKYPRENVLGVVNIADKISGESFTEREQTLLSVLAGQAVAAIENYKLCNQLQEKIEDSNRIIRELNETQNQLIQSEKMATVGQLAFGIAHEIRNPLGIILGGVEFLKNKLLDKKDKVTKESVEKIKQSIDRTNNIIIDLLKFSRASQLKLQSVNVCKTMDEVVSLIKNHAYLNNVQIKRNYTKKIFHVKVDLTMLRQAFFNLCINAIDAMPKGGKLTLNIYTAQNVKGTENNVIIEILDTGKGIPEDVLPKIFDPFFTTKEPEKGTGLGLSIVRLILERHKGIINVESKIYRGTKFIIKLPVAKNIPAISKEGKNGR